jgi:hypothetical protein
LNNLNYREEEEEEDCWKGKFVLEAWTCDWFERGKRVVKAINSAKTVN